MSLISYIYDLCNFQKQSWFRKSKNRTVKGIMKKCTQGIKNPCVHFCFIWDCCECPSLPDPKPAEAPCWQQYSVPFGILLPCAFLLSLWKAVASRRTLPRGNWIHLAPCHDSILAHGDRSSFLIVSVRKIRLSIPPFPRSTIPKQTSSWKITTLCL